MSRKVRTVNQSHYVDPVAFTALFHHRRENHQAICLGLARIAAGVGDTTGRRLHWRSADLREEVTANALLAAIERIDRFDFGHGDNAFSYYTSVIFNSIKRQKRDLDRRAERETQFSQLSDAASATAMAMPGPLPLACGKDLAEVIHSATPYARAS